ncbi:hypothetical protein BGW80DRAFT_1353469 [Lactifluus volemus]|nr:hypothetical protein BGW80DRAFT_1353469 [Lactifluus volemus]
MIRWTTFYTLTSASVTVLLVVVVNICAIISFCIDTNLYIHLINITHPMAVLICGHPWSDVITWMIIDQCVPTKLANPISALPYSCTYIYEKGP